MNYELRNFVTKLLVLVILIFCVVPLRCEKIKTKKYPFIDWNVSHTIEKAKVEYVLDGDTVRITDGRVIRLLGVNAPEVAHPIHSKLCGESGGEEAKSYATGELLGKKVILVVGKKNTKDIYGRTLGLIFYNDENGDQKCFNWELIKTGHGEVYIFSDDRLCVEDVWGEK